MVRVTGKKWVVQIEISLQNCVTKFLFASRPFFHHMVWPIWYTVYHILDKITIFPNQLYFRGQQQLIDIWIIRTVRLFAYDEVHDRVIYFIIQWWPSLRGTWLCNVPVWCACHYFFFIFRLFWSELRENSKNRRNSKSSSNLLNAKSN